jgi:integrase/recombinase XerD
VEVRIPNVISDTDRYGTVRYYYRTKGKPKIRLVSPPGSPAFLQEIERARAATKGDTNPTAHPPRKVIPGSFRDLLRRYYAHSGFTRLDWSTQKWTRRALEYVANGRDDFPIALAKRKHLQDIIESKAQTPAIANEVRTALRKVFKYAVAQDMIDSDPTTALTEIEYRRKPHKPWTDEEIERYERTHREGSNARLALALLRYTGCRIEDAPRLGPNNFVNGRLRYTMAKGEERNPIDVDIPVLPELSAAIASAKRTGIKTFLVTIDGRPYGARGFAGTFRYWCQQARVNKSAHGFRKRMGKMLAEGGATPHESMAWLGHRTLQQVQTYSKDANRARLADAAATKLGGL